MEILKNFVVFEGIDGSGTTTQLKLLQENLNTPPSFHITCEPTDTIIGKIIRTGLRKEAEFDPKTLAYLFAADRNEHIFGKKGIMERCKTGELVVSDRYFPSSLVYQGLSCGNELPELLNRHFPLPELLFFFDIDPKIAEERMADRAFKEIFEHLDFQKQARELYKEVLEKLSLKGTRIVNIDSTMAPEYIAQIILQEVQKMPIFNTSNGKK